jgi:hypothetical protein
MYHLYDLAGSDESLVRPAIMGPPSWLRCLEDGPRSLRGHLKPAIYGPIASALTMVIDLYLSSAECI